MLQASSIPTPGSSSSGRSQNAQADEEEFKRRFQSYQVVSQMNIQNVFKKAVGMFREGPREAIQVLEATLDEVPRTIIVARRVEPFEVRGSRRECVTNESVDAVSLGSSSS